MTSYFFDTNILFKIFFNRMSPEECELKDYLKISSDKFISKNVEYEFSNIFLEFSNESNHFLIEPYYRLDELENHITFNQFQKLLNDMEILKFNSANISSMIWKCICGDNKSILKDDFKIGLNEFIFDFNTYFHFKYHRLMNMMTVHSRLENYEEITDILKPHIHRADLNICLDAHDVAVKCNIDNLVFVSADKIFSRNSDMITENTKIKEIILI